MQINLSVIHNEKEMLGMRGFDAPRMKLVYLANEEIITASTCSDKYCYGYTCNQCEDEEWHCSAVTPCTAHNCQRVLCPSYEG